MFRPARLFIVLKKAWLRLTHEDINLTAAALSYTTVLSLVPVLAVLLALMTKFDYFGQVAPRVEKIMVQNISQTAGSEGVKLIQKAVSRIQKGKLGTFGALILILIVTRTMMSLDRAVHRIWNVRNKRKIHRQILLYWGLLLVVPMLLAIWSYAVIISRNMGFQVQLSGTGFWLVFIILLLVQTYLPSFEVRTLPVFLGTSVSMVLLYALTLGFTKLTTEVYTYSKIYGSMAAIPTFLLWIYLIWLSILLGIAVTAIFSGMREKHDEVYPRSL